MPKRKSHGKAKKQKGARRNRPASRAGKRSASRKKPSPRLRAARKPSAPARRKPARTRAPKKPAQSRRRLPKKKVARRPKKAKRAKLKRNEQGGLREFQGRVFGKTRFGSWAELLAKVGEKLLFYYPEIGDRLEPDEDDEGDNE